MRSWYATAIAGSCFWAAIHCAFAAGTNDSLNGELGPAIAADHQVAHHVERGILVGALDPVHPALDATHPRLDPPVAAVFVYQQVTPGQPAPSPVPPELPSLQTYRVEHMYERLSTATPRLEALVKCLNEAA